MPARETIIGKLDKERELLLERYRALSAEDLSCECTESEAEDGAPWSAKDHLAHLAMIERAFQQMIRKTLEGAESPVGFTGTTREEVIAGVHNNNERNVEEHKSDDLDTLIADLEAARAESKALLDSLTDEQLEMKVPGAPWADGSIGGVLITNGYHEDMHWKWVEEGLAKVKS